MFDWLYQWRRTSRRRSYPKSTAKSARKQPRLELLALEDRVCPSTYSISSPETISGSWHRGDQIQFIINIGTNDPSEGSESEDEAVTITSDTTSQTVAEAFLFKAGGSPSPNPLTVNYTVAADNETFSYSTSDGDETGTIIVNGGGSAQLQFTTPPHDTVPESTIGPVILSVKDASGNAAKAGSVTLQLDPNNNFPAKPNAKATLLGSPLTVQVTNDGQADFSNSNLMVDLSGNQLPYDLLATYTDANGNTTEAISAPFRDYHTLKFLPFNGTFPNQPLGGGTGVQVEEDGPDGKPDGASTDVVTLALSDPNNNGGTLSPTSPTATVNQTQTGVAVFSNLTIDKPGEGYTLGASVPDGAQATSDPFAVGHVVKFEPGPHDALPGASLQPVTVNIYKPSDGTTKDDAFQGQVQLTLADEFGSPVPAGVATLTGGSAQAAPGGTVTFSNLSVDNPGTYTLLATLVPDEGIKIESSAFVVGRFLNVTMGPSLLSQTVLNGQAFDVQITAADNSGNVDTNYNNTVTLTVTNQNGETVFPSGIPQTLTMSGGQIDLPAVSFNQVGHYTFTVSGPNASTGTSGQVAVQDKIVYEPQPPAQVGVNQPFDVTVKAEDVNNNVDAKFTDQVSLYQVDGDFSANFSGLGPVTAAAGVADFPNLSVDTVGPGYTLAASDQTNYLNLQYPTTPPTTPFDVVTPQGEFQFSVANTDVSETDGTASITVTRLGGNKGDVSVQVASSDGSAAANVDYGPVNQTVQFKDGGATTFTFPVPIIDDSGSDPSDRSFTLTLSSPTGGATLGSISTATVTIHEPADVQFSTSDFTANDNAGTATITLIRTGSMSLPVQVHVTSSDGTATAPADYTAIDEDVVVPAGAPGTTFTITINNKNEGTLNLMLSNAAAVLPTGGTDPNGASLGDTISAVLTINENDITAKGVPVTGTEGQLTDGSDTTAGFDQFSEVATFTDSSDDSDSINDYQATIDWGDGNTSNGTIVQDGPGQFHVDGRNFYEEATPPGVNPYTVKVTITETGPLAPGQQAVEYTVNTTATIADAKLQLEPNNLLHFTEGVLYQDQVLAVISDDDIGRNINDYVATIDYGDGAVVQATSTNATFLSWAPNPKDPKAPTDTRSADRIIPDPNDSTKFDVVSNDSSAGLGYPNVHVYNEENFPGYTITVTVKEANDATGVGQVQTSMTAQTDDAALIPQPETFTATQGVSFTGEIGKFTDQDFFSIASDYAATITWPDGSQTTAGAENNTIVPDPNQDPNQPQAYIIIGTHTFSQGGLQPVGITLEDVGPPTTAVIASTAEVDFPPTITSDDNAEFVVGTKGGFTVTTTGLPTAQSSLSADAPSWLTLTNHPDGSALLSGTPPSDAQRTYQFTITASNGIAPDFQQPFTLTVDESPSITSANHTTFTIGATPPSSFPVKMQGLPAPQASLSANAPAWLTITNNPDGTATLGGTPPANAQPTYQFTIIAHNSFGPDAQQPFTLTVVEPPRITSANTATFHAGTAGSFPITMQGMPVPQASLSAKAPSWLKITNSPNGTATLSGKPPATAAGVYAFTITAHNGTAPDFKQSFTLVVSGLQIKTKAFSVVEQTAANVTVATFSDSYKHGRLTDYVATITWGDGTSSTATAANGGIVRSGTGFAIKGKHIYGEEGSYPVSVTISDAITGAAGAPINATVTDAALKGHAATIHLAHGTAFSGLIGSFTDPGTDGTTADYSAVITWGDGHTTTASAASSTITEVIVHKVVTFQILGTNTYAKKGTYKITITVSDHGGKTVKIVSTAVVK